MDFAWNRACRIPIQPGCHQPQYKRHNRHRHDANQLDPFTEIGKIRHHKTRHHATMHQCACRSMDAERENEQTRKHVECGRRLPQRNSILPRPLRRQGKSHHPQVVQYLRCSMKKGASGSFFHSLRLSFKSSISLPTSFLKLSIS